MTLALDSIWPRLRMISLKCIFQDISCIWSSNVFFLIITRKTLNKRTGFHMTHFNYRISFVDKTTLDNKSKQDNFGAGSLTPNELESLLKYRMVDGIEIHRQIQKRLSWLHNHARRLQKVAAFVEKGGSRSRWQSIDFSDYGDLTRTSTARLGRHDGPNSGPLSNTAACSSLTWKDRCLAKPHLLTMNYERLVSVNVDYS